MTAKEAKKKGYSTADSLPYENVRPNGMFELEGGLFSKSYRIPDVNFKTVTDEVQGQLAIQYRDFLSTFAADTDIEVTLYNRTTNEDEFRQKVFLPMKGDNLNIYREEYNQMLSDKMKGARNNLETVKILTVTVPAENAREAEDRFRQIDRTVDDNMTLMTKQSAPPMTAIERLELLNEIYNQKSHQPLYQKATVKGRTVESFTLENCARQGITTKEVIAPSAMMFKSNIAEMDDVYMKSFCVAGYPTWIKGTILTDFASLPTNMLVSVHFHPIDQSEAIKFVRRQGVNINSAMIESQKRAIGSGYNPDLVSPSIKAAHDEAESLLDSMTRDNSKLFTVNFVFTLMADSEEDMKNYEEQLKMIANRNLLTIKPLNLQQEDGLATALPLGVCRVYIERLMSSESVAAIIPFDVKEIKQDGGMYYGLNAASHNMIIYDRTSDINPNASILGMPGAGKSFAAKREMVNVILSTDDEIYIIDPEREYRPLAEALGGSVVKIANGSVNYINPLDMNMENVDDQGGDPVKIKADFVEAIMEIMIGGKFGLSPIERAIIGRSVMNIYDPYVKYLKMAGLTQSEEKAPTLADLYNDLASQPQQEAQDMALALERYIPGMGTFDIFSHHTNINVHNRFIVYDVKDVGMGLKELGLQVCLDHIWNRMIENFANHKRTWIYIDEFYLMMQKESSASYIAQIWKRARKWNGVPCAITQNVEDMLKSENARTIINNCSFVMMLGQSPINRQQLSAMFDISQTEQRYISSGKAGMGLIHIGNDNIPMDDKFPTDTQLYKIMSTKPEERL